MIVEYFPETDMLYIQLAEGISAESEEVAPGIVLDFDEENRLVGIEIEEASSRLDISRLEIRALPLAQLIMTERELAHIYSAD